MSAGPSPAVRDALRTLGTAARAVGKAELAPPLVRSDDDARAWAAKVTDEFKRARRTHARELAVCEAKAAAGRSAQSGGDLRLWKGVEDAVSKLESELISVTGLKARLAEGRRSMTAKAARVVQEHLNVVVEASNGRVEATLDPRGVERLQKELPQWVLAWADYGYQAHAVDMYRTTERLWMRRDGNLPIQAPPFEPLQPPAMPSPPKFPTITQAADLEGMGGIFKHARSILYGVMSMAFIFGLRSTENQAYFMAAMPVVAVGAVVYGYMQNRSEQASRLERFEVDVARKAEQAVKDVLRTWYDRQADKILEHAVAQLHARRTTLIHWYRSEVLPAQRRAEEGAQRVREEASKAQSRLGNLQRQKGDHEKAKAALAALLGTSA